MCGSVDAIAEHKHIYEAACVDTNPDVENDQPTFAKVDKAAQI